MLLFPKNWERIKRDQGMKIISARMLLNPLAAGEATFLPKWLVSYDVLPSLLNVYILVDPSKGKGARSDRTTVAAIGIDRGGSKYLLEGACHRGLTGRKALKPRLNAAAHLILPYYVHSC